MRWPAAHIRPGGRIYVYEQPECALDGLQLEVHLDLPDPHDIAHDARYELVQ